MWGSIALTVGLQMLIVYAFFLQSIFKTTALHWSLMLMIAGVTAASLLLIGLGWSSF